jgi:hypothetical protein
MHRITHVQNLKVLVDSMQNITKKYKVGRGLIISSTV